MTVIQYMKDENVKASLEAGRSLALNFTQVSGLKDNFKNKLQQEQAIGQTNNLINQNPTEVPPLENAIPNTEPQIVNEIPVAPIAQNNTEENTPVINITQTTPTIPIMDKPVIDLGIPFDQGTQQPEASQVTTPINVETPTIDNPINMNVTPTEETKGQVEIVSTNNKKTEYDALSERIIEINRESDNQIKLINEKRQEEIMKAIEDAKQNILDLQDKAAEHLKNAQAAEQIAHIAYENAQNAQI